MTQKLKFIEVCSGAGGLSSGFINKKFVPILLNDVDKVCCKTLKKIIVTVKFTVCHLSI